MSWWLRHFSFLQCFIADWSKKHIFGMLFSIECSAMGLGERWNDLAIPSVDRGSPCLNFSSVLVEPSSYHLQHIAWNLVFISMGENTPQCKCFDHYNRILLVNTQVFLLLINGNSKKLLTSKVVIVGLTRSIPKADGKGKPVEKRSGINHMQYIKQWKQCIHAVGGWSQGSGLGLGPWISFWSCEAGLQKLLLSV